MSSSLETYAHEPEETLDYTVDFADLFEDGETIALPHDDNVTVTVPDGLTLTGTPTVTDGTTVTAWITDGDEGTRYVLTYTVTSTLNRTYSRHITLNTVRHNDTGVTPELLVTADELRSYMSSIGLTADQAAGAQDALLNAQSELAGFLNRPLTPTTVADEVVVEGRNGFLFTRHTPVLSVASVTREHDGVALAASAYHVVNGLIRIRSPYSAPGMFVTWDALGGIPGRTDPVSYLVSYTASLPGFYPESLGALRGFIFRVATREVQNMHDDVLSVKDLNADDVTPVPPGPNEDDFKRVERWKRPVVAT